MSNFAPVLQMKSSNVKNIRSWVRTIQLWHSPFAERFPWWKEKGRVGQDIYKRRLLRFDFDVMKSWENFNIASQKQSNGECPVVCYKHALTMPYCRWCIRMPICVRCVRCFNISAWGFRRCSFRQTGQFLRASRCEASNSNWASRLFLCLYGRWF